MTENATTTWKKSSRSMANGNCVEVTKWLKSSRSYGNGACVEIAAWSVRDLRLFGDQARAAAKVFHQVAKDIDDGQEADRG